jgi:hypothetical protein
METDVADLIGAERHERSAGARGFATGPDAEVGCGHGTVELAIPKVTPVARVIRWDVLRDPEGRSCRGPPREGPERARPGGPAVIYRETTTCSGAERPVTTNRRRLSVFTQSRV